MIYCQVFFAGSLIAAGCSAGLANLFGAHIGRSISFLLVGTCGGLILAGIGLLAVIGCFFAGAHVENARKRLLVFSFFSPFSVIALAWLFSLQTSAV